MAKKPNVNVGMLLFMYIWLTGWSAGVAAIQSAYLLPTSMFGDDPQFMLVFVFSHGGTEVGVIWHITRELKKHSDPPQLIDYEQALDNHTIRWRNSVPRRFLSILAVGLAVIVYSILFTPIFLALVTPVWPSLLPMLEIQPEYSVMSITAVIIFSVVWILTMRWWVQAYRVLRRGLTTVEMVTTPINITVTERKPGFDIAPLVFKTGQVKLEVNEDEIVLSDNEKTWRSPFPYMEARNHLGPVEQVIAAAQPHGPVAEEVPEALEGLRKGTSDSP